MFLILSSNKMCIMGGVQVANNLFPYFTIIDQFAAARETTRWFVKFHYGTMDLFWTRFPI